MFILPNNTWPTDNKNSKEHNSESTDGDPKGASVGLYNLGNTCYMNSAMQCIVNQKHMHEYFVKEKLYLNHLNLESVLGYKGDLAVAFANLMG